MAAALQTDEWIHDGAFLAYAYLFAYVLGISAFRVQMHSIGLL